MSIVKQFPLEVHEEHLSSQGKSKQIDGIIVKNWYYCGLYQHSDFEHILDVLIKTPEGFHNHSQKYKETKKIEIRFSGILLSHIYKSPLNASDRSKDYSSQEEAVKEQGHVFQSISTGFIQVS